MMVDIILLASTYNSSSLVHGSVSAKDILIAYSSSINAINIVNTTFTAFFLVPAPSTSYFSTPPPSNHLVRKVCCLYT